MEIGQHKASLEALIRAIPRRPGPRKDGPLSCLKGRRLNSAIADGRLIIGERRRNAHSRYLFAVVGCSQRREDARGVSKDEIASAPWFGVFSELFRPVTPELAGLALFHCARGCAETRISAYVGRNAFHATSPSALCASSAR